VSVRGGGLAIPRPPRPLLPVQTLHCKRIPQDSLRALCGVEKIILGGVWRIRSFGCRVAVA
jgi:hypothetical protein